ncbi:MAG: urocanate hydratase, partial [Planctomyces sp.]
VTMCDGVCLIADVDRAALLRRQKDRYLDEVADSVDGAIDAAVRAAADGRAVSIGAACNAVELLERLLLRQIKVDVLTDQTGAHDIMAYVPAELTVAEAETRRSVSPAEYERFSLATMARHVRAMLGLKAAGAITFDYGNNLRQRAFDQGVSDAFAFPGFVPAYIRPQFCVGRGPFRWVALSGEEADIRTTDRELAKLFPE